MSSPNQPRGRSRSRSTPRQPDDTPRPSPNRTPATAAIAATPVTPATPLPPSPGPSHSEESIAKRKLIDADKDLTEAVSRVMKCKQKLSEKDEEMKRLLTEYRYLHSAYFTAKQAVEVERSRRNSDDEARDRLIIQMLNELGQFKVVFSEYCDDDELQNRLLKFKQYTGITCETLMTDLDDLIEQFSSWMDRLTIMREEEREQENEEGL